MPTRLSARLFALCLASVLIAPLAATLSLNTPARADSSAPSFADPRFEQEWTRTDSPVAQGTASRAWLWGPEPGEVRTEPFAGEPGGVRTVQYFDKGRMEVNSAADPSSAWAVTSGLLVVELTSGKVQIGPDSYEQRSPAQVPVAGDASSSQNSTALLYSSFQGVASLPGGPDRRAPQATGAAVTATIDRSGTVGSDTQAGDSTKEMVTRYAAYSPETGHNIPDVFVQYMQSSGPTEENGTLQDAPLFDPTYLLGYPITEAYWATVPIDGKPTRVLIQLYQRRVLTYVPDYSAQWQVQMGNVGQQYLQWRYAPASISVPTPSPTVAPGADDTFVHASGSSLYYAGKPVTLKGTNYWLSTQPGVGTWVLWDGPAIQQELDRARQLGVNSIRVGIPYDQVQGLETVWGQGCATPAAQCNYVNGPIVSEMEQFLQIASSYNMKVIFNLFDWSNLFPAPGTAEYQKQLNYLQGIVAPFANDDRVIGWDLHNEPENYDVWKLDNRPDRVLAWLANIAGAVRSIDHRHLLTVGVADYRSLWLAAGASAGGGSRIIDIVDFVSLHCYDAGGLGADVVAIKAQTSKPVLLEEMGWPTGPASLSKPSAVFDEATQEFLYRTMLPQVQSTGLAGVMQWTLEDNPLGTAKHYIKPDSAAWFGLVRRDGSFKPAAADFRDMYHVSPLPSSTTSNLPLTKK